ncbi:MAG: 2Fe-2S iron-sulfur cluster-binding protein [Bacteroidales bacterium]
MIKLKIDNIPVEVPFGTSVLLAAQKAGIKIPSMCFKEGYSNHPSCMVCMVKDSKTGKLFPSCAIAATEGMEIITSDDEVYASRKEALELLLSDHVGDCEAPCQPSCPAGMNIPLMNRLIAQGKFDESLRVVKETIALPFILGYICPAPCEKACRRGQIDEPVSICLLKKFVALKDLDHENTFLPDKKISSNKKVAIVGTGPAGLAAAFYTLKFGHEVVLFDKNEKPGGALRYQILHNQLPDDAVEREINVLIKFGARFKLNYNITKDLIYSELKTNYNAVILATGDFEGSEAVHFGLESGKPGITINKDTYETSEEGIFACGNIIRSRRMAIHSVAQGKIAATSVNAYLNGQKPSAEHQWFNSKFGKLFESEFHEYLKESIPEKRKDPDDGRIGHFTNEQAMLEAQRCLHCDCRKIDNCKLRIYSDEYDADRRKFAFGERKAIKKYDNHESIIYEPEKCIRCNLCVDITSKNKELTGLSGVGRGFTVEINIPFTRALSDALTKTALEVAESCPTGAISLKNE